MPAFEVADLPTLEILDSRGRPTLAVTVLLTDGTAARAGCRPAPRPAREKPWNAATATRLGASTGCGHLKTGAPARGERVAKYNRLLEIAAAVPALRYGMP
jgi:enolase